MNEISMKYLEDRRSSPILAGADLAQVLRQGTEEEQAKAKRLLLTRKDIEAVIAMAGTNKRFALEPEKARNLLRSITRQKVELRLEKKDKKPIDRLSIKIAEQWGSKCIDEGLIMAEIIEELSEKDDFRSLIDDACKVKGAFFSREEAERIKRIVAKKRETRIWNR